MWTKESDGGIGFVGSAGGGVAFAVTVEGVAFAATVEGVAFAATVEGVAFAPKIDGTACTATGSLSAGFAFPFCSGVTGRASSAPLSTAELLGIGCGVSFSGAGSFAARASFAAALCKTVSRLK
jgi:hypothetical protein